MCYSTTDTPTYGNGESKSTFLENTGIFDDDSIKVLKVKIKGEILEKEMGMYWKYISPRHSRRYIKLFLALLKKKAILNLKNRIQNYRKNNIANSNPTYC